MTPSLATLFVLLAAAEPSTAPAPTRIIEIMIVGPEASRAKMEEDLRPLIGDDPKVRWVAPEGVPGGEPPHTVQPEGRALIWIDVASPTQVRIYLPDCSTSAAGDLRTVHRLDGGETDLVALETVAQIVKAAVQVLRSDSSASAVCEIGAKPKRIDDTGLPRAKRRRRLWLGMGSGIGWGYVPPGSAERENAGWVGSLTERAGAYHLLPEVGFMWSDDFAVAAQVRWQFIDRETATYKDPRTGETHPLTDLVYVPDKSETRAIACLVRAIWYRDLSNDGDLRLSLSADLGGGFVRFPLKPVASVYYDPSRNENMVDWSGTRDRTDTRRMGTVLFGGSAGLWWSLARHFALALDVRVLSAWPDWGALVEGEISAQVGL